MALKKSTSKSASKAKATRALRHRLNIADIAAIKTGAAHSVLPDHEPNWNSGGRMARHVRQATPITEMPGW